MKNDIINILKQCYDPEIPIDLWNLGLIYDINISEDRKLFKEVIEKLVELYPDACRVSDEETKYTPLHCAALTGRSDVMKLLLKTYPEAAAMRNGWKMCKTCRDGKIPLDIARAMNQKECVKILEPVSPPEPSIPMWIWCSLLFC